MIFQHFGVKNGVKNGVENGSENIIKNGVRMEMLGGVGPRMVTRMVSRMELPGG